MEHPCKTIIFVIVNIYCPFLTVTYIVSLKKWNDPLMIDIQQRLACSFFHCPFFFGQCHIFVVFCSSHRINSQRWVKISLIIHTAYTNWKWKWFAEMNGRDVFSFTYSLPPATETKTIKNAKQFVLLVLKFLFCCFFVCRNCFLNLNVSKKKGLPKDQSQRYWKAESERKKSGCY